MGLPSVVGTPQNLLISGATSGSRTQTISSGSTLFVAIGTTAGGAGVSVSGAGATWTKIAETTDGTRRNMVFRGSNPTAGASQTVTVSFTNSTTCRWTLAEVSGISAATPDAANDSLTTASSARTSTNCSSAGITTPANVFSLLIQVHSATLAGTATVPSGWTRITAATGSAIVLGYIATSTAFSAEVGTVSYSSTTSAAQATIAAFNGDDQTTAYTLTADNGALTLTGQAAGVNAAATLTADNGALTVAGQAAGVNAAVSLTADRGALTLTGQAAGTNAAVLFTADAGALALTGQDANLPLAAALIADVGALTLAGQAAALTIGATLPADAGALVFAGQAATLTVTIPITAGPLAVLQAQIDQPGPWAVQVASPAALEAQIDQPGPWAVQA
jgi:hypothetical protein